MGKTPQLLVTAVLGYVVAVACSAGGGAGGSGHGLANAGAAGALGWAGDAGAGLGIEVPDAAAAGEAGGAACDCAAKAPTVVIGSCVAGPMMGAVECTASFPGRSAQDLLTVQVYADVTGCAYPQSCDSVRQQAFAGYAQVTYMRAAQVGVGDGVVKATFSDGITSATFVLP